MVTSVTPPQHKVEVTVHGIAIVDVGGVCLAGFRTIELHVAIGAESLQDGTKSLLGPLKLLTKAGMMPGCPTACGGEEWHPC